LFTKHVQIAEGLDGGLHQAAAPFPVGDVVVVGDGLGPHGLELVHHLLGRGAIVTGPVDGTAQIVHDDLRPFGGEQQGVFAALCRVRPP